MKKASTFWILGETNGTDSIRIVLELSEQDEMKSCLTSGEDSKARDMPNQNNFDERFLILRIERVNVG